MATSPVPSKGELGDCWAQILLDGDTVLFTASTPIERSSIIARSLKIVRKWGAAHVASSESATKPFLFGAAKAIGHNRNLAARLPLPKIYPEAIRRTSPELT